MFANLKVLICVSKRYNSCEFWITLGYLQKQKIEYHILSQDLTISNESGQQRFKVQGLVKDYPIEDLKNYAALIFISGNPQDTEIYWHDPHVEALVAMAIKLDIVIAAICAAVPAIRLAVRNKNVAHFPLQRATELLRVAGANITFKSFEVDGKIITAENAFVTLKWVQAIADVLRGLTAKVPTRSVGDITLRDRRNRKPNPEIARLLASRATKGNAAC